MFVKSINWIDEDSQEAEIIVSDGCIEVICFSHPLKKGINSVLEDSIHCFDAENVVLAQEQSVYVNKSNNHFAYSLRGKLVDKKNKLVHLGDIILCLEDAYISNGIPESSYVEFDVSRLDLY